MGTDPIILFRTDGNAEIATGHVMRCLSVARALAPFKSIITFYVSDSDSQQLVQKFLTPEDSINVCALSSADYRKPEQELSELLAFLQNTISSSGSKPVLFIDSYFVTENYFKELAPYAHLVYLDDLQLFNYQVDLVINYDVLSPQAKLTYEKKYSNAGKCLLGERYTPLRSQFSEQHAACSPVDSVTCHVLITSGGSDAFHTCLHLSQYLLSHIALPSRKIVLHIVVGMMNPDKEELATLAKSNPQVILHENVKDMAALMSSCQLSFSAAGTTLYELCAMGIPTASFVLADNQLASATAFADSGAVALLGDVRTQEPSVLSGAASFLSTMLTQPELYQETSAHMKQLIDGQGATRIAKALIREFTNLESRYYV